MASEFTICGDRYYFTAFTAGDTLTKADGLVLVVLRKFVSVNDVALCSEGQG